MFLQTLVFQITKALADALLACLGARPAGALLTTPTIELWSSQSGTIGPSMIYSQFTKCTFSGYAGAAITLVGPVNLDIKTQGLIGNVNFIATTASPFVPDTVAGYMLSDGVSTVYGAEQFQTPVGIGSVGAFLDLSFAFPGTTYLPV